MNGAGLQAKLELLSETLRGYKSLAVAFSGGVDSTFLLKYARDTIGESVLAITVTAPNFPPDEIARAADFCSSEGIRHLIRDLGESFIESFASNPEDRCYICKKGIFSGLLSYPPLNGMLIADGTNADDALDYRPGERALSELGIKSPLREAGLTKNDIRQALKEMGLQIWDKPALACLASRIPYGEEITPEKLRSVYSLESLLHESGFSQVRVRRHGDVARIEVLPGEREKFFDTAFMDRINEAAKNIGFAFAALDLAGYKMGNMNMTGKSQG